MVVDSWLFIVGWFLLIAVFGIAVFIIGCLWLVGLVSVNLLVVVYGWFGLVLLFLLVVYSWMVGGGWFPDGWLVGFC